MSHVETDLRTRSLRVPCPVCNGDGFVSHGDRHTETNTASCKYCHGYGSVVPKTGQDPRTSASPDPDKLYADDRPYTKVVQEGEDS